MRNAVAIASLCALLCASQSIAEVGWYGASKTVPELRGEITKSDVVELQRNPRLSRGQPIILEINSVGGDWEAALQIGRLLRRTRSTAFVESGRNCLSACVMVLAGATDRKVLGRARIGIHRPYSSSTAKLTYEEAQTRYRALESSARSYLREMNSPDALFDAMVRVPAERIRILTPEEVESFGLSTQDPVAAEIEDAAAARKYGLDRQTYLERKRLTDSCKPFYPGPDIGQDALLEQLDRYERCRESILRTGAWDGR
ncbi:MAG TPA: ATP-dependent Clp protease proteolytic subunit [Steroidobacteraceae bacterium]|nr:ATP-dependent Clp protease proteolytic subunit [Steroidobacteraceae bacterium]